jgi:hypothetical protein
MAMTVEELLARARHYWPSDFEWYSGKTCQGSPFEK